MRKKEDSKLIYKELRDILNKTMRTSLKIVFLLLAVAFVINQEQNTGSDEMEKKMYDKFQRFLEKFGKKYESVEEYEKRFQIFKENYKTAKSMKNLTCDGDETTQFSTGTTQFSDLTPEEFQKTMLTDLTNMTDLNETEKFFKGNETDESLKFLSGTEESETQSGRHLQGIPESWDWRDYGAVTSVKNQGNCGGCWAFCSAANIEGLLSIHRKQSISLSPQQMIDCDYGNNGCYGGMMGPAYNYLMRVGGIQSWRSYPYLGYRGYCRFNSNNVVTRISGWTSAGSTNEEIIKAYLYRTGPLAITINARTLQYYKGGVYNVSYNFCPIAPDHGVLLVGYGTTSTGLKYWIIKNSWGPNWGEGGYFRIARGRSLCGVNQYVVSARLG